MKSIILSALIAICSISTKAQIYTPVKWSYAAKKINKTEVILLLKATIDDGWHIYSVNQQDGGPSKTAFTFTQSSQYNIIGKVQEPMPVTHFEDVFKMDVSYFEKSVIFQQRIKLTGVAATVNGKVSFMACTNQKCLPPDQVEFKIPVK